MEIVYQEHSFDEVAHYFSKGFHKVGQKIIRSEAFFCPDRKTVVFKLFVESNENQTGKEKQPG